MGDVKINARVWENQGKQDNEKLADNLLTDTNLSVHCSLVIKLALNKLIACWTWTDNFQWPRV